MKSLLNRSFTKKFILEQFKARRAGQPMTRVSMEYIEKIEAKLRATILSDVDSHCSKGKTFNP